MGGIGRFFTAQECKLHPRARQQTSDTILYILMHCRKLLAVFVEKLLYLAVVARIKVTEA